MTTVKLPYIKSYPDRHNKPRHYFRWRGFSVALPSPGTPGFLEAYERVRAEAEKGPKRTPIAGRALFLPGSVGWIVEKFLASDEFKGRAANTQRLDRRLLDPLREHEIARALMRDVRDRHIKLLRDNFSSKFSSSIGDQVVNRMSVLWQFADEHLDLQLEGGNPTSGVKRLHVSTKSHEPWTPEVFEAFEAHAPGHLRLGVMLLRYTGQRRSDVVNMKWSQYDGEFIEVPAQMKTGEFVVIPCHEVLKATLDQLPRNGEFILHGKHQDGLQADSLSGLIRRVLRRAGVTGFSIHGLRSNAAQALAEAGCSVSEIMAITGHKTPAMAMKYARRAEKRRLARNAINRWEAADAAQQKRSAKG